MFPDPIGQVDGGIQLDSSGHGVQQVESFQRKAQAGTWTTISSCTFSATLPITTCGPGTIRTLVAFRRLRAIMA
jgi:hypothetical protein